MKARILIAFFSAMVITLVAVSDMRRTSPGPLAAVHGRVEGLNGANDCSACHGGFFESMQAACLECHGDIEAQLQGATGLHATLGARTEQCGLCHAEHHGVGTALVHGQSFALAQADITAFDHARIGFVMDGKHLELDCAECHANAKVSILPEGQKRFLGLDQDCAACHEDKHEGRYDMACASCHGQTAWKEPASLGHERFLPLVGGHGDVACGECHAESGPRALDFLGQFGQRSPERTCVDCHESPHGRPFVVGVAKAERRPPKGACVVCHEPEHETFHDGELLEMSPERHAASGFALEAPHADVECRACHDPNAATFAERYPGRPAERCASCHEDPHEGQFTGGTFALDDGTPDCRACHAAEHFDPPQFGVKEHRDTALPLEDSHRDVDCAECHEKAGDAPRVFHGTPSDCDACHADGHGGFFDRFTASTVAPEHGDCARCHDATTFAAAADAFDHARWTGFAVDGAHAQAGCQACHAATESADASGRTFGRVAEHFGSFHACQTCHTDPHGQRFDASDLPAQVESRGDCARCHVTSSFRAMARDFEHGFWTGFHLYEAHGAASCSACHAPLLGRGQDGRTTALALGPACADCHEDPHGRQFLVEGTNDCTRCHDDEFEAFLSFDHETDARFALGEAHGGLACSACHGNEEEDGRLVVRYRPLGTECVDCHGNHAEVLLRRRPRRR